jgi:hypothetical protein
MNKIFSLSYPLVDQLICFALNWYQFPSHNLCQDQISDKRLRSDGLLSEHIYFRGRWLGRIQDDKYTQRFAVLMKRKIPVSSEYEK